MISETCEYEWAQAQQVKLAQTQLATANLVEG